MYFLLNIGMFHSVGGRNPAPVGSLCHYSQGFIHPRWCRISSMNSSYVSLPEGISRCFPINTRIRGENHQAVAPKILRGLHPGSLTAKAPENIPPQKER